MQRRHGLVLHDDSRRWVKLPEKQPGCGRNTGQNVVVNCEKSGGSWELQRGEETNS